MRFIQLFLILVLATWPGSSGAQTATAPAAPVNSELLISGKVTCALKRTVIMPFTGVITALPVQPGEALAAGAVLAGFRLQPEAQAEVRRRLFPSELRDLQLALAKLQAKAQELASQKAGLQALAQQQLTSPQSLAQVERDSRLVAEEQAAVQARLAWAQKVHQDDLAVLRQQLGHEVRTGQMVQNGQLRAPIQGHLLWMHPDLRVGAEIKAGEPVFRLGVMHPMLILAQVHELEAMRLRVGDRAEVEVPSLPQRRFAAQVSRLAWSALATQPDQPSFFEVEFTVANPDFVLKDGLKVRLRVAAAGAP